MGDENGGFVGLGLARSLLIWGVGAASDYDGHAVMGAAALVADGSSSIIELWYLSDSAYRLHWAFVGRSVHCRVVIAFLRSHIQFFLGSKVR